MDQLGHDLDAQEALIVPDFVDELDAARADEIGDDMLRLIFTACHPVLSAEARVAMTLKLLAGLTTHEIARAFLVSKSTIAQRIVRAKRSLRDARVPFEALRLGRMLAELAPDEPEVHGLVALMELQASRAKARVDATGRPVLLPDQDRSRWNRLLIRRGLTTLRRAEQLAHSPAPYALQAAIAACHARTRTADDTDWVRIAELYGVLAQVSPSLVVELNRAVAIGMAFGPAAGLEIIDALRGERSLQNYHWLPSVRGDLLAKLGRTQEARAEFEQTAHMARNARERALLLQRTEELARVRSAENK